MKANKPETNLSARWNSIYVSLLHCWFKYDLVLHTPCSTQLGFKLMTFRSWHHISHHWDECSNHSAISDFIFKKTAITENKFVLHGFTSTSLPHFQQLVKCFSGIVLRESSSLKFKVTPEHSLKNSTQRQKEHSVTTYFRTLTVLHMRTPTQVFSSDTNKPRRHQMWKP